MYLLFPKAVTSCACHVTMGAMPSPRHDALVEMFSDHPHVVVEILRDLIGVELPETTPIQQEERTFNTRNSDDIEVDLIFTLGPQPRPWRAILVEIQLDKSKDPRQLARYAAAVWLQLGCDVTVLVICPEQRVADHYAQPIDSGLTGYRLRAEVLGPDIIPVITDAKVAAMHLVPAIMSVMVHGRNRKVIKAFAAAINDTDDEHAPKYTEYAYSMSGPETRRLLEEIMTSTTWPVYSPFAREHFGRGREEGKAEGKAEGTTEGLARAVLILLSARGLDVPEDVRTRITDCTDLAQLEAWVARAGTVRTCEDLFDDLDEQQH
ncbi:hypothetical protein [Nonomuraea insulae]|uniref:Transposase (putative) YhgA-like domain-containing protein n=1 Tax=Nonomuraea insulae TaxID=1616787 RepID=A0ABW1CDM7_9ACTN